jgi:hypothetical protein
MLSIGFIGHYAKGARKDLTGLSWWCWTQFQGHNVITLRSSVFMAHTTATMVTPVSRNSTFNISTTTSTIETPKLPSSTTWKKS